MRRTLVQLLSLLVLVIVTALCVAVFSYTLGLELFLTVAFIFLSLFFKKRWYKWFYILYKTLPRDCIAFVRFLRLNVMLYYWERRKQSVCDIFLIRVQQHPDKVCFYFEDTKWTFREVEEMSNKVARYFKKIGFKKGDTVALLMESRPEYVCFWLGLSKIGVITALINNNLVRKPLTHSITIAHSKAIILGSDYVEVLKEIRGDISPDIKMFQYNTQPNAKSFENSVDLVSEFKSVSSDYLGKEIVPTTIRDKMLYVYTSGTTGLPKAAVVTQSRFFMMTSAVNYMLALRKDDIIYDPLPLYHSAGTIVGAGQAIISGITVAIRRKFSASNYWKDCIKYNCTVAQYIGELCRYLLAVPVGDESEKKHNIRRMFGNGLRPQIWHSFVERFNIEEIGEFYGATEGNSNIVNFEGVPGAVGFKPRYIRGAYPIYLVKYDELTGEPTRNSEGYCTECDTNEPGIFIGKINKKKPVNDFAGYTDIQATKKKVLENVFQKGDVFFNSGDVLVMDELGYFFFKDRTGDTFRWKGENVATTEVEGVISNVVNLNDAVVYGVEIPHTDGKCGMVAIVDTQHILNLQDLAAGLKKNLPAYACPLFVRILKDMPLTGTFKLKKVELQKEGYDITKIKDAIYFYKSGEFIPLTEEIFNGINSGKVRV